MVDATELETPACALCGSVTSKPAYRWRDCPYGVVRCSACRYYFLSPRPSEQAMIRLYSQDDYFEGDEDRGYASYRAQEQALRMTFARLLATMARRGLGGGRLLEVGCGLGYLLDEAATHFSLRHGTDFSAAAVASAAGFCDQAFLGGMDALPSAARYDCIISNHVIEHVYRPQSFIDEAMSLLAPGGRLILSTPNMGSLWRRCLGRRWPSFKLPEHIQYFDQNSLMTLMSRSGAVEIRPLPYPHAFPAALIAAKLGLKLSGRMGQLALWIPGTTLALSARKKP